MDRGSFPSVIMARLSEALVALWQGRPRDELPADVHAAAADDYPLNPGLSPAGLDAKVKRVARPKQDGPGDRISLLQRPSSSF